MSDAPTSVVSPLLIIIVIFVVVLIFLNFNSETQDQIFGIFDEAFFGEEKEAEAAKLATIKTHKAFLEGIDECKNGATVNPDGKNECFCHTKTFGEISDQSYFSVQNSEKNLLLTALTQDQTPITSATKDYTLGLFSIHQSTSETNLVCIFPSQYFIQGEDIDTVTIGENIVNNWNIIWKDARADRAPSEVGTDYTFGLYSDKDSDTQLEYTYGSYFKSAPVLYKISDTQYCLLTDLIEHPLSDTSGLNPKQIYSLTEDQLKEKAPLTNFFLDSSKYCNKDSSSSKETSNIFAPNGIFYWFSQAIGQSGESVTLFGTKWSGGYICAVEDYSFTVHLKDLEKETFAKIIANHNKYSNGIQLPDDGIVSSIDDEKQLISDAQIIQLNPACIFQITDFDAYDMPILDISCKSQYANGYTASSCNELFEGGKYFQNLAPTDIEGSIPDLNDNGFDPNVYYTTT